MDIQQITGTARKVSQLLANTRYGLDYYQREYNWKKAQVESLIDDLTDRFRSEFDPTHERPDVESYRPYFLGPIVTVERGGVRYLVDGQQRITTLSLLLIYLRHALADTHSDELSSLDSLIFSTRYGRKTFNLDVEERDRCLRAILNGEDYDTDGQPASVQNICKRYDTIRTRFPDDLHGKALVYFSDWLQDRVIFVDIVAPSQDMALEIFETMNDRGLRLSSTDMLKSFLLSEVRDETAIDDLNTRWRRRVTDLADFEENADAEFVKAWLRGNYAQTQRQRKSKAAPRDFEIIGTAFHKWVRDNAASIGLSRPDDFRRFVEHEFMGLSSRYLELLRARWEPPSGFEAVYYNACAGFTLQLPVILAAVTPDDDNDTFRAKAALIAGALEIYFVRRMVNYRNFGYSTVVYTMFNLLKKLRNQPTDEVRQVLVEWLDSEDERLDGLLQLRLTQRNRWHIHYILARITAWLDGELGSAGSFGDYFGETNRRHPFEVEHIWADRFDRHTDDFDHPDEFQRHRNRIGALLLLPKDFNASYGAMDYKDKVEHYYGQNPLARSLHPRMYQNNPTFLRLIDTHGLTFTPFPSTFTKADIDERQALYRELAEHVWAPSHHGLG